MNTKWLLDWSEGLSAGVEVCGGKGWNLSRLACYGFPVPAGGILTAQAYHDLINSCLLKGEADQLQALDAESVTEPSTAQQLESLRKRILSTPLPEEIEESLMAFLTDQGLNDASLAVRSSAVAEDGDHHSFAGIHESRLGVPCRLEELQDAVRRCYASLWTPQAVAYRRHAGVKDIDCGCAVVICKMVTTPEGDEPVAAGVLFTCDPISGRRDQTIINSVSGLADRLVAGAETPEQSTVNTHLLRYQVTARKPRPGMPLIVDDEILVELSRWGMRAQWALGDGDIPQDIEWAFDGREVWFLQARPVTRVPHRSFDALASMPVIWSNANLKEVVGGLPSAFSWSVIQDMVRDMLFTPLQAVRYNIPEGMPILRRFLGRSYFDLSALQWAYYDCFGYLPEQLNREIGGNQPAIPVSPGDPMKGAKGRRRQRRQLRALFSLIGIGKRLTKAYDEALTRVVAFREICLDGLKDAELRALLLEWHGYGLPLAHLFQFASSDAGVWLKFSRDLLTWLDPEDGEALLGRLLAAGGNMPSAEALNNLYTLASVADGDPEACIWLQALREAKSNTLERSWQELPPESTFRAAFVDYLKKYGHRTLNETELANPRWCEVPDALLQEIARLQGISDSEISRQAHAQRDQAEREVKRFPWWSRPLVRALAARARRGMARRETGKSLTVAVLEPLRHIANEVGRRLVDRDLLQHQEQVFQLAFADLDTLLAGTWDGKGAKQLVEDRESQREAWKEESANDVIIDGDETRLDEMARGGSENTQEKSRWRGIGVSPGRAHGRARVLRDPEEGVRLGKGEILVAATTDTGWTPLFLRASGVVTEVGGYLSHGSIVARELGIPAVVNLPNAIKELTHEPIVRLDGGEGVVQPITEVSSPGLE